MKNLVYIITFAFLFIGCKSNVEEKSHQVSGYDDLISEKSISGIIEEFSCIQLECTPECTVPNINKIELTDSLILVSDFERVLAFSMEGKFLRQYGVKGNAENEYITIGTFMLDSEGNIVIVDSYSGKLIYFKPDGKYLHTTKIDQSLLANIQDGYFINNDLIFTSRYIYNDSNTIYNIIDISNQEIKDIASTEIKTANTMERIGLHPFSQNNNDPVWILPFSPHIYSLDFGILYTIVTSKPVYNTEKLESIKDFSIMTYSNALENKDFLGFTDIFDLDNYIFLRCFNLDGCIIDKSKLTCKHFSFDNQSGYSLLFSGISTKFGEKLIGIIQPYKLAIMSFPEDCDANMKQLQSIQNDMVRDGNPIIISFKLK